MRGRDEAERGFTLIEVLVVVAVTILLAGISLTGFGGGAKEITAVFIEGEKISELILRAKALAITTYNIPPIPCGFGVVFDYSLGEYSLVDYDVSPDDPLCRNIANGIDRAKLAVIETRRLPENVLIHPTASTLEVVMFLPPDPKTYLYRRSTPVFGPPGIPDDGEPPPPPPPPVTRSAIQSGSLVLTLISAKQSKTFKVAVNTAGQLTFPQ